MMTKDRLRQLTGDERLGQMRESEYLGAEDIDDGVEPVLTIAGLWYGSVTLQRGKENKDVLSFTEERVPGVMQVRPLIVNSTNRKTLRKLFGDAKASTLVGKQIQLFVDHNVRDPQDGGMTDGIRIRPYKPRVQKQEPVPPCTDCGQEITPAMGKDARWLAGYNLLLAFVFYGTEGLDCSILFAPSDYVEAFIPFNITCGTLLKYQILLAFTCTLSVTGITLFLSAISKNQIVALVAAMAIFLFPVLLPITEVNPLFRLVGLLPIYHVLAISLLSVEQMSNGMLYAIWAIPAALLFLGVGAGISRRVFAKHQVL